MKLLNIVGILCLLIFGGCGLNDNPAIDARLLRSGILNYKNPSFPNEPPWLQYVIILENKSIFPVVFHSETGYLIIESKNKHFQDSINVIISKKFLLPQELDTIYVTDLFLKKKEAFCEKNWINPDVMYFLCIADSTEFLNNFSVYESMQDSDSVIYLKSFSITKAKDFTFAIE